MLINSSRKTSSSPLCSIDLTYAKSGSNYHGCLFHPQSPHSSLHILPHQTPQLPHLSFPLPWPLPWPLESSSSPSLLQSSLSVHLFPFWCVSHLRMTLPF